MKFSTQLKHWRQANKLGQEQAASRLAVPIGTLRNWEQGRNLPSKFALGALIEMINEERK